MKEFGMKRGNFGALTWDPPEHRVAHEALEALGVEAGPVHGHRVLEWEKNPGLGWEFPGFGERRGVRGLGRDLG